MIGMRSASLSGDYTANGEHSLHYIYIYIYIYTHRQHILFRGTIMDVMFDACLYEGLIQAAQLMGVVFRPPAAAHAGDIPIEVMGVGGRSFTPPPLMGAHPTQSQGARQAQRLLDATALQIPEVQAPPPALLDAPAVAESQDETHTDAAEAAKAPGEQPPPVTDTPAAAPSGKTVAEKMREKIGKARGALLDDRAEAFRANVI